MKYSLGISNFLEEISSLSHSVVFLYFFALITEERFLICPCYSLELCIQMLISFVLELSKTNKQTTCCDLHQRVFCLCFFLGLFVVSGHTFRASIHFVYGVRNFFNFNFFFYMQLFRFPITTVGELTIIL